MLLFDLEDYLGFGPIEVITTIGDGCLKDEEIDLLSTFIDNSHASFVGGLFQWYDNAIKCLPKSSPCRNPIEEQFTKVNSIINIYIEVKNELFKKFKGGVITDVDLGNYKNFMFNYRCEVKSLLKLVDGDEITSCSISDGPLDKCLGTSFAFNQLSNSKRGLLSVGNLTSSGQITITDYVIEWYDESNNVVFTSGEGTLFSGQYTYTHPLTESSQLLLLSGVYSPKIKYINYGGVNYSDDGNSNFQQNDFNGCLNPITVLPYDCLCNNPGTKTTTSNIAVFPNFESILNDNLPENTSGCLKTVWGVEFVSNEGEVLYTNGSFYEGTNFGPNINDLYPNKSEYISEIELFAQQNGLNFNRNGRNGGTTVTLTEVKSGTDKCDLILGNYKVNLNLIVEDDGCGDEPCDSISGSAVTYTQPIPPTPTPEPEPNYAFEIVQADCSTTIDGSSTYQQVYSSRDDGTIVDGDIFYTDSSKTIPFNGSGLQHFINITATDGTPVFQNSLLRYEVSSTGVVMNVVNCTNPTPPTFATYEVTPRVLEKVVSNGNSNLGPTMEVIPFPDCDDESYLIGDTTTVYIARGGSLLLESEYLLPPQIADVLYLDSNMQNKYVPTFNGNTTSALYSELEFRFTNYSFIKYKIATGFAANSIGEISQTGDCLPPIGNTGLRVISTSPDNSGRGTINVIDGVPGESITLRLAMFAGQASNDNYQINFTNQLGTSLLQIDNGNLFNEDGDINLTLDSDGNFIINYASIPPSFDDVCIVTITQRSSSNVNPIPTNGDETTTINFN